MLNLQVSGEQKRYGKYLGQLNESEGSNAKEKNLHNLECVVPHSVPAWQNSQSSNNYVNNSKHMTQDRKFGFFLAKSPFSF